MIFNFQFSIFNYPTARFTGPCRELARSGLECGGGAGRSFRFGLRADGDFRLKAVRQPTRPKAVASHTHSKTRRRAIRLPRHSPLVTRHSP